jgi:hypothetical protein
LRVLRWPASWWLDWFIYAFVRKETVVSSQIEGTQATLIDLLQYEAVLTETSGKQRDRTFAYTAYLEKLRAGTEV